MWLFVIEIIRRIIIVVLNSIFFEILGKGESAGRPESAGINRHRVGDERALHERSSCSIVAPSYASMISNGMAKR